MKEFIHWSKPCLLLSTTCDEILHLICDSNYSTINLYPPLPPNKKSQRMTKNVVLTCSVGELILSKPIRVDDTKYHIYCTSARILT